MGLADLTADVRTGTGERRTVTLADGSELLLNAQSAADIQFDPQRRLVRLQMYWDGAAKPAVDCPAGDFFGAGLGLPMASREHSLSPGPRRTPPAGHARAGLEQGQNQQGTMRPIVSLAIR